MKDFMTKDLVICPYCNCTLDRLTLYKYDCFCTSCGTYIDVDEADYHDGSYIWDDYDYEKDEMFLKHYQELKGDDDMLEEIKTSTIKDKEEEQQIGTFVLRFITSADYETIKKSFKSLEASIEFMSMIGKDGPISTFLRTTAGKKLVKGLDIEEENIDEYIVQASFLFGDGGDSKKILISTLCKAFPLFAAREEDSYYIMTNNKGLAKGLIDVCSGDDVGLLAMFLTGYEKYKLLVDYLDWCDPYRSATAEDIMIQWDNKALISFKTLKGVKEVPIIWQEYLASVDDIKVSKDDKDSGTTITFERILEDVADEEEEKGNLVQVVSLRGIAEYALGEDEDETTK